MASGSSSSRLPVVSRCSLLVAALLAPIGYALADEAPKRHDFSRPAMGTLFRIALYAADETAARQAAERAFGRVEELNGIFSDYLPESELMRLCARAGAAVPVSAELFSLIERSQQIAAQTDGAFDITVGRMTQLWRRSRRQQELPSSQRIAEAKALTGWRLVTIDAAARTVTLAKPGILLDLGGIAKGRAADEALRVLAQAGFPQAIVIAGGDMAIGAPPPNASGWEVKLKSSENEPPLVLRLHHCGVSTSGDLHQFVEIEGRRYSHIVDAKTGLGLTNHVACSVIAPDATTSDALATAFCVLGSQRGLEVLASLRKVEARFVSLTGEEHVTVEASPGFPPAEAIK